MQVKHYATTTYRTVLFSDKGKVFSKEEIFSRNLLNYEEKETFKIQLGGKAVEWWSDMDHSGIPEDQYINLFDGCEVDDVAILKGAK